MQESDTVLAVASTFNIQASGHSATESVEAAVEAASDSISTLCTPAIPSTSATISFHMVMLVTTAIAAGILPPRNGRRWAVNKQQYGCTSTEDL